MGLDLRRSRDDPAQAGGVPTVALDLPADGFGVSVRHLLRERSDANTVHLGYHPTAVERLTVCYEALASAVEIVEELSAAGEDDPITLRDMYYLLAESQSMLWAALRDAGIERDQDQTDAFIWLREKTREHRVFVERYMRREDPADPANGPELQERLEAFAEAWRSSLSDDRIREVCLRRLAYHVHRISEDQSDEPTHDWEKLSEIIDELSENGLDPQSDEVSELLAPLPDDVPDVEFCEAAERALNIEAESA